MHFFSRIITGLLLLLPPGIGYAQTPLTDSLRQAIYRSTGDQKIAAMIALCNEYKSLNRDTLDLYAFRARELAMETGNQRLRQEAELVVGYDYLRWGWMDSTIATVDPLITANRPVSSPFHDIYFKASRVKAMSYAGHSRYTESLSILYQVVEEAEKEGDSLTVAENSNSIASIALLRNQHRDAFTWLSRALAFCPPESPARSIRASILVNLADAYSQVNEADSARWYIKKGISLLEADKNYFNLAIALQRLSSFLVKEGELHEAEDVFKRMQHIRAVLGDTAMYQDQNLALINFYLETNQVQKAVDACNRLLATGDLHNGTDKTSSEAYANNISIRLGYYEVLAKCYKILGRDSLYQVMLENIINAKDSFYHYNSASAIAELETKYEVQKKENTIIQQKLDITQKNNRFYALLGIYTFLCVVAALLFFGYKKRQKIKLSALLEKEKLQTEQSVARAQENERKRIAADLHDNLGAYAASMVSNLDVVIPHTAHEPIVADAIQSLHSNSMAIVSQLNDTIWVLKKDALALTTISDRIKTFLQRIEKSYPDVNMQVQEQVDEDILLSPSQGFHLFRIVQEAVNNALRHSKTKKLVVHIFSSGSVWKVMVADEGMGFPADMPAGNGFGNMRERAKEAGWNISWEAGAEQGTVVVVTPAMA